MPIPRADSKQGNKKIRISWAVVKALENVSILGGGVAQWLGRRISDQGAWFEPRPVHIALWP